MNIKDDKLPKLEYTFKVRAYVNGNGKKYGSYSNVLKVKTATKAPGNLSVASKSKSAVLNNKTALFYNYNSKL